MFAVGLSCLTGQRLVKSMGPLFDNVVIEPCLLHGDLWSGNISSDKNGEPVILDPACYCKLKLVQISVCCRIDHLNSNCVANCWSLTYVCSIQENMVLVHTLFPPLISGIFWERTSWKSEALKSLQNTQTHTFWLSLIIKWLMQHVSYSLYCEI